MEEVFGDGEEKQAAWTYWALIFDILSLHLSPSPRFFSLQSNKRQRQAEEKEERKNCTNMLLYAATAIKMNKKGKWEFVMGFHQDDEL